jgi:hypothetical protein
LKETQGKEYDEEIIVSFQAMCITGQDTLTHKCRTTSLYIIFIPATIRDWNNLHQIIKEKRFKRALLNSAEFKTSTPPTWFNIGPRPLNIILARIRNNCPLSSAFVAHLHNNHVLDDPTCPSCHNLPETTHHFFL